MKTKMRNAFVIVLAAIMAFTVVACGSGEAAAVNSITVDGGASKAITLTLNSQGQATASVAIATTYAKDAVKGFDVAYTKGGVAVTSGIAITDAGAITVTDSGVYKIVLSLKAEATKTVEITVNVSAYIADLTALINGTDTLTEENYTTASWSGYSTALTAAQAITATSSQSAVNAAKGALQAAIDGLVSIEALNAFFASDLTIYTEQSLEAIEELEADFAALSASSATTAADVAALLDDIGEALVIDIDLEQTTAVARVDVGFFVYYNNAFDGVTYEEAYELRAGAGTEGDPYTYTPADGYRLLTAGQGAFWAAAAGTYRIKVTAANAYALTTVERLVVASTSTTRVYGQDVPQVSTAANTRPGLATGKGAYYCGPENAELDLGATPYGVRYTGTKLYFADYTAKEGDWDTIASSPAGVLAGGDYFYEFDYASLGSKDGEQWPKVWCSPRASTTANARPDQGTIRLENILNNAQNFSETTVNSQWGGNFAAPDGVEFMLGVKIRVERRSSDLSNGKYIYYVNGIVVGERVFGTEATEPWTGTAATSFGNSVNSISFFCLNSAAMVWNFDCGKLAPLPPQE
jgi:hypothetical protein